MLGFQECGYHWQLKVPALLLLTMSALHRAGNSWRLLTRRHDPKVMLADSEAATDDERT